MRKFKITTGILGIIVCMTGFYCTFNLPVEDVDTGEQITAGLMFFTGIIINFIITFYPSTEFKNNLK